MGVLWLLVSYFSVCEIMCVYIYILCNRGFEGFESCVGQERTMSPFGPWIEDRR